MPGPDHEKFLTQEELSAPANGSEDVRASVVISVVAFDRYIHCR